MRVPKEIFIKGNLWKIEYKWRLSQDGKLCDGLTDISNRVIYLSHGLGEEKFSIFLHEYCHAIMAEVGLYHTKLDEATEEIICHNLSEELVKSFIFRKKRRAK